jgi:CheY-like chemotaxis protein
MHFTPNIMIVEESQDIITITSKIFGYQKWQVTKASTGEEALSYLISNVVDIILMDINLPTMSGFECCQKIRNLPDKLKSNIPIIAVTGNSHRLTLKEYQSKGFSYFFQKPVDFDVLLNKIKTMIELKIHD